MTRLGRQDGKPLIVDLRDRLIETPSQLWDALAQPCWLPDWFGRNLDAWNDTLCGGISATLDEHPLLIIELSPHGLFAPGNEEGQAFIDVSHATVYRKQLCPVVTGGAEIMDRLFAAPSRKAARDTSADAWLLS